MDVKKMEVGREEGKFHCAAYCNITYQHNVRLCTLHSMLYTISAQDGPSQHSMSLCIRACQNEKKCLTAHQNSTFIQSLFCYVFFSFTISCTTQCVVHTTVCVRITYSNVHITHYCTYYVLWCTYRQYVPQNTNFLYVLVP